MSAPSTHYKIVPRVAWSARQELVPWAPIDLEDGFVHLSTRDQLVDTARRHFAGRDDLVVVAVDTTRLPAGHLRWEPSRGGALFPHVYGDIPTTAVCGTWRLDVSDDGRLAWPAGAPPDLGHTPKILD